MTPLEKVMVLQKRAEERRRASMNKCQWCGEQEAPAPSDECKECVTKLRKYNGPCHHNVDPFTDCPLCKVLSCEEAFRRTYAHKKLEACIRMGEMP